MEWMERWEQHCDESLGTVGVDPLGKNGHPSVYLDDKLKICRGPGFPEGKPACRSAARASSFPAICLSPLEKINICPVFSSGDRFPLKPTGKNVLNQMEVTE